MTKVRRVIQIDHSVENLYELVSDIGRYPDFIKWIKSMRVDPVSTRGAETVVNGHAQVGFKGFSEPFSTKVVANESDKTIKVSLISGPLQRLANEWRFEPAPNGSKVHFYVDFEFRNFLLRALAAANFEIAMNRIMAAFVSEADRRYK